MSLHSSVRLEFSSKLMDLYLSIVPGGSAESWLLIAITSTASILGTLLIYVDLIWNKISSRKFSILHSDLFLGGALALSSGTLITVGLFSLLPSSVTHIVSGRPEYEIRTVYLLLALLFIVGVVLCFSTSWLVHVFASRSIVVCQLDMDATQCRHKSLRHGDHEHTPLRNTGIHDHGAVHCEVDHYPDAEAAHSVNAHPQSPHSNQDNRLADAEATATVARSSKHQAIQLLSIGLQTVIGLAIHRFPEGLLLFTTSRADKDLGLSLVVALAIHSFSEGFTMAAPLYGALKNRALAAAIAIVLGCGPQILGAFIGYKFVFKNDSPMTPNAHFNFGLSMAGTAGFMFVISTQMLGAAFTYMAQRTVTCFVVAGALIVLGSKAI